MMQCDKLMLVYDRVCMPSQVLNWFVGENKIDSLILKCQVCVHVN